MVHGRDAAGTRWSLVLLLHEDGDPQQIEAAWNHVYEHYAPAMIACARAELRRLNNPHCPSSLAEDAVHAFLASAIEKRTLAGANRSLGRFRAFLRVLLKRSVQKYVRARTAQKRAPTQGGMQSIDESIHVPGASDDGADAFDRAWVACLLQRAVQRVATRSAGTAEVAAMLVHADVTAARALLREQGVEGNAAAKRLQRTRRMLAQAIESEMAETVCDDAARAIERHQLEPYVGRYLSGAEPD